jgi:hypothetical protein
MSSRSQSDRVSLLTVYSFGVLKVCDTLPCGVWRLWVPRQAWSITTGRSQFGWC